MSTPATETIFSNIFTTNTWGSAESVSGAGSELSNTAQIIRELPALLHELRVQTFLDMPCGDFNWMQHANLEGIDYLGADIVADLVQRNNERFGRAGRRFEQLDLLSGGLPKVDLVLCRDCLFHFSHADVFRALHALVESGSKWLLTTTFTYRTLPRNQDIDTGGWTPINLEMAPYHLPPPRRLIIEGNVTEAIIYPSLEGSPQLPQTDRCLGLWLLDDVRETLARIGR